MDVFLGHHYSYFLMDSLSKGEPQLKQDEVFLQNFITSALVENQFLVYDLNYTS